MGRVAIERADGGGAREAGNLHLGGGVRCETACSVPRPTSLAAQARSAKSRWLFVHDDPPVTTELFPLRLSDECKVPLHLPSSESAPRHSPLAASSPSVRSDAGATNKHREALRRSEMRR